jgi:hypothetical protein
MILPSENIKLLKIDRLIPEYMKQQSASMDTSIFILTQKRSELARLIHKYPRPGGAPF